ncbi:MAG TPA: hypothetical protein VMB20_04880 [Candidatus Acidoferrum sp.]|nr:hypothetical protein [Candidatus Acidoferrum sp.]
MTAGSIALGTGSGTSPQQTVTLASTGTCSAYYEAFATGAGWQGGLGSPGSLSGLTVTFAPGQGSGGTLNAAGSPYYIAFVCF